jgi:uncharacterized protein with ATP-grasp and redox domains
MLMRISIVWDVELIIVLRDVSIVLARGFDNCAEEYIYYRASAIYMLLRSVCIVWARGFDNCAEECIYCLGTWN